MNGYSNSVVLLICAITVSSTIEYVIPPMLLGFKPWEQNIILERDMGL